MGMEGVCDDCDTGGFGGFDACDGIVESFVALPSAGLRFARLRGPMIARRETQVAKAHHSRGRLRALFASVVAWPVVG